jgi:hypothetical protein
VAIVVFKGTQACVEKLTLRHDHDVETRRDLVATKNLSNQSLSSIPSDRSSQLSGCGDPESAVRQGVRQRKHRAEPSADPGSALIDELKLSAAANALARPEARQTDLLAADGQALATFGAAAL